MRTLSSHFSILYRTVQKSFQDGAADLASTIAFYALFSVFPLLLAVISLTSYFVDSDQAQQRIYELVGETFPGSAELVRANLETVVRLRGAMGIAGLIGLLWSASAGFGAMTRAVNRALELEPSDSYVTPYVRRLLMTIAVSALLILSVGMTAAVELLFDLDSTWLGIQDFEPSAFARVQSWAASFVLMFLMFSIIYRMAPRVEVRWGQVVPGALLAAAIFEVGKAVFLFYLDRVARFEVVYGSLSSIMVLLAWLYFSALTLVFGAEYNIVRAREGEPERGTDHRSREE